jgi:hypothetical protein
MLAVTLDNLLFILLIAAAALFQLLSKAVTKAGKKQSQKTSTPTTPSKPPQARRAPAESDAERVRKFLEALGQPPTSPPPPPVAQRTDIPPRPLAPVQPPPVIPRAWGFPREQQTRRNISQREIPSSETRHLKPVPRRVSAPAVSAFEVREATSTVEVDEPTVVKLPVGADIATAQSIAKESDFKTEVVTLLASQSGLRQAIILREIFSLPRGLQSLDVVEGL